MIFLLLGILLGIVIGLILYARWNYGKLDNLGFPVVKPHWLLGSTHDMHLKVNHFQDYAWFKQYGPVFGVYEGRSPQVFICDPELVREICVKNIEHFRERREIEFGDPIMNQSLDFIHPYDKWKTVRSAITPMFASGRIKKTSVIIGEAVTDYVDRLTEDVRQGQGKIEKFNIFAEIFNMNCDVMSRCIFSLKVDNPRDPNNFMTKTLAGFVETSTMPKFLNSVALSFPFLRRFVPHFSPTATASFEKLFQRVIQDRKKSNEKKDDLVNQLVNLVDQLETPEFKKLNIDMSTIMAQAVIFFIAGPDQYANCIACLALFLQQNPHTLKKLYQELDFLMEKIKDGEILHEHLTQLVYTNACIQETLRLVPPFIRPERICTKDWEYNGIQIKKGMQIMIALYAANRNPEYFPDPDSFKPERWLPENKANLHPYAFMSFGHGPRNCIATRLNFEILPMIVANVFSKFEFKLRPDTKLEYLKGSLFLSSFEPIYFDVVPRTRIGSKD